MVTTEDILFGPLILTANLILLLRGEVVLNVEGLADLLGRFALDHVRDSLAPNIEKSLDVEVIGSLGKGNYQYWQRGCEGSRRGCLQE